MFHDSNDTTAGDNHDKGEDWRQREQTSADHRGTKRDNCPFVKPITMLNTWGAGKRSKTPYLELGLYSFLDEVEVSHHL